VRQTQWPFAQILAVRTAAGGSLCDVSQGIRTFIAIAGGIDGPSDADRVEDEEQGAGH
jgi:hypothetical protein